MSVRCVVAFLGMFLGTSAAIGEELQKKILIIGIDGCRTDALKAAKAPTLHALLRDGAFSDKTQVLPERQTGADTVSGPGWCSILTGVWADKHGVHDNDFKGANLKAFPHFFSRLKQAHPQAYTASFVTWAPIHRHIVSAADDSQALLQAKEQYPIGDARGVQKAVTLLKEGNPAAVFVHQDQVDGAGHDHGFSPKVPAYLKAIEEVDGRISQMLQAMRQRRTYAQEDWLVIVCTDHVGQGTGHGGGQNVPEIREVFLIVSGPAAERGKIEGPTFLVDVAATALTHLGIRSDPAWKLDGRPVGLKARP